MTGDRTDSSEDQPQRPAGDNPDAWRAYWQSKGQPWRTRPEINEERQEELERRHAITPDPERDECPFKDVELSRGDVEWFLATHEDGCNWLDRFVKSGDRQGLDLRDANLYEADLNHLGLSSTRLEGAKLGGAHLEGADLSSARLEGANLRGAHLEGANLRGAHLEGADLTEAHLKGAKLGGRA